MNPDHFYLIRFYFIILFEIMMETIRVVV